MKWIIGIVFLLLATSVFSINENFCDVAQQVDSHTWLNPHPRPESEINPRVPRTYSYCNETYRVMSYVEYSNTSDLPHRISGYYYAWGSCVNDTHFRSYRCDGSNHFTECSGYCDEGGYETRDDYCLTPDGEQEDVVLPQLCTEPPINVPEFPALLAVAVLAITGIIVTRKVRT